METFNPKFPWLALLEHPAFCVQDGVVVATNSLCECHSIAKDSDVRELLRENFEIYQRAEKGHLYLKVYTGEASCDATVTKAQDYDIFTLCISTEEDRLNAYALAAQQLRIPLSNVMTVADGLFAKMDTTDAETARKTHQINRGLFQLLRVVSNMSDAGIYRDGQILHPEVADFTGLFAEILEKAQTISEKAGIALQYTLPQDAIIGLAYPERLERAVYNLLSNAIKFSSAGSTVEANLTKNGDVLIFTVLNCSQKTDSAFWNRYNRNPSVEDSRNGLGLGMTLIGAAATAHGGTVLIDHPTEAQTRVTLTIPVKKPTSTDIRSPGAPIGDYAGGRDKGLLEFSELLPSDSYKDIN